MPRHQIGRVFDRFNCVEIACVVELRIEEMHLARLERNGNGNVAGTTNETRARTKTAADRSARRVVMFNLTKTTPQPKAEADENGSDQHERMSAASVRIVAGLGGSCFSIARNTESLRRIRRRDSRGRRQFSSEKAGASHSSCIVAFSELHRLPSCWKQSLRDVS